MHIPRILFSSCAGLCGLALTILLPGPAVAAWPSDPLINVPVCAAANDQTSPVMVADGAGGVIVAWTDHRNGTDDDIYAQHVLASGVVDPAWPANGLALCTATDNQYDPVIVADEAGGAIVAWLDHRRGGSNVDADDVYAQHVLAGGAVDPAWPVDGSLVSGSLSKDLLIVTDGAGGAIVAWEGELIRQNPYAQHLLPSGVVDPAWPVDGTALWQDDFGVYEVPSGIVPDGTGGAIVAWSGTWTMSFATINAQRIMASGATDPAWGNGRYVAGGLSSPGPPILATDGSGGFIAAWTYWVDPTDTDANIGAAHVTVNGVVGGSSVVCAAANDQLVSAVVSDGAGGAVVVWADDRDGDYTFDIFVHHVLASGAVDPAWPINGGVLCDAPQDQGNARGVTDGSGGAIVTWADKRNGTNLDIYAQHALADGQVDPAWPVNGRALCTAPNTQSAQQCVTDGAGGAIAVWQDNRGGTGYDIYAQRVLFNGQLGDNGPTAAQVSLVSANVREGTVRLRWSVSVDQPAALTVYRRTDADPWQAVARVSPDGSGFVSYEDATVVVGARYGYRLGLRPATGVEEFAGETWVDVPPSGPDLAVLVPSPVTTGEVTVSFAAPAGQTVRVGLFDLAGRRVVSQQVAGGSARRNVALARSSDLAPGVYLVRVELDRPVVARVVVIR